MNGNTQDLKKIRLEFKKRNPFLKQLKSNVLNILSEDTFIHDLRPIILKGRIKDEESLLEKVVAKNNPPHRIITPENLFQEIEDLVGVRLVLAQKAHIGPTVERIRELERDGFWEIVDESHYVWHPLEIMEVRKNGIPAMVKPTSYCSRHFILKQPNLESDNDRLVKCELQVRTILEEAIFENDHRIRYKKKHDEFTSRVLSRLAEILETADQLLVDAYAIAEKNNITD